MPTLTTKDGTRIYYKDWGEGQPVVFSHGWPLSADAWDDQMFFLAERGFRCIAHDRRGHGRSSQPWDGNDLDTYADDLSQLVDKLGLHDAIHVGHSTGGGEVARYLARRGGRSAAMAVLIDAIPPLMVKTASNPDGMPKEIFDDLRKGILADRSQFFKDFTTPFYGANRGTKVSQGLRDSFWLQSMMCGFRGAYACVQAFSETDQFDDLKKLDLPTLIIYGDEDQIVPIKVGGERQAKLIKDNAYHVIKGAPHGVTATHKNEVNKTLLEFIQEHGGKASRAGAKGERAGRRAPPAYGA